MKCDIKIVSGGQTGVDQGALEAALDLGLCTNLMRSHFVVSFGEADAVEKVRKWLAQFFVVEHPVPFVLNFAGPRESKSPGIQSRTRLFLSSLLTR